MLRGLRTAKRERGNAWRRQAGDCSSRIRQSAPRYYHIVELMQRNMTHDDLNARKPYASTPSMSETLDNIISSRWIKIFLTRKCISTTRLGFRQNWRDRDEIARGTNREKSQEEERTGFREISVKVIISISEESESVGPWNGNLGHHHEDGIDRNPNAAMRRCHPNGQQPLCGRDAQGADETDFRGTFLRIVSPIGRRSARDCQ